MAKAKELILKDYAGQHSDAVITIREDGSLYVTFTYRQGYGFPSLEKDDLKDLITLIKVFESR